MKFHRIVSCSNHHFVKRIDLLLGVASEFKEYSRDFLWTHIGTDNKSIETCKNFVESSGLLETQFQFVEYRDRKWLKDFYLDQKFDIFVNLSETEGLPVSMIEAASVGLPFLGTRAGGIPEIVDDGINGVLVDIDTPAHEIALKLRRCLEDQKKLSEMSDASRQIWSLQFNADYNYRAFARRVLQLLKEAPL